MEHQTSLLKRKLDEIDSFISDSRITEAAQLVKQLRSETLEDFTKLDPANTTDFATLLRLLHQDNKEHNAAIEGAEETKRYVESLNDSNGWTVAQQDENVRVSYREEKGSPYYELLIESNIPSSMPNSMSVIAELDLYTLWMPLIGGRLGMLESQEIGQVGKCSKVGRLLIGLPWPFANREFIVFGYTNNTLRLNGTACVIVRTVTSHPDFKIPEPDSSVVRAEMLGVIEFQPVSTTLTKLRVLVHIDVHMSYIPPAIINLTTKQILYSAFHTLRRFAQQLPEAYAAKQASNPSLYEYIAQESEQFYSDLATSSASSTNTNAKDSVSLWDGEVD